MGFLYTAVALAAFLSVSFAAVCQNMTIPISISARNGVFNISNPTNNVQTTNFFLDATRQGHNYTNEILTGYKTVTGDYNIEATYCHPDSGPSKVIQVLTHGLGFDRSYWDFSHNNYNYSYVRLVVDRGGYSTLSYDRLGVGQSTLFTDPINEGQIWLEAAALRNITLSIRGGRLGIKGVSSIVHVGHSFGSSITYALTAADPTISDGIVLTGFSQGAPFAPYFGLGSDFIIANTISGLKSYATGYLAPASIQGAHIDFFAPGNFDPDVLTAAYSTGAPVTPGEVLTLVGASAAPSTFAKPVLVITGERDIPYCGGDCMSTAHLNISYPSIPAGSKQFFPNAGAFQSFIVPGAGHGLALEYTHGLVAATISKYLGQNGLSSR